MFWREVMGVLLTATSIFLYIPYRNSKMYITSVDLTHMTSFLDINIISTRETFPASLMKIRHDDVTWRHFWRMWPKSAEVIKSVAQQANQLALFECIFTIAFQGEFNHFQAINSSPVMGFLVFVVSFDDVIMLTAVNMWHVTDFLEKWKVPIVV